MFIIDLIGNLKHYLGTKKIIQFNSNNQDHIFLSLIR